MPVPAAAPTSEWAAWAVREGLERAGMAVLGGWRSPAAFEAVVRRLGRVLRREDVRLYASARGAHQPRPLALHTDRHDVDVIAWRCVRPEPGGGATLVLDGRPLLAATPPADRRLLARVTLDSPCPDDRGPPDPVPLVDAAGRLYYTPWSRWPSDDPAVEAAWAGFRARVEAAEPRRVRLAPGECLFVDNRRVLHGRERLPPRSRRWLQRVWLAV